MEEELIIEEEEVLIIEEQQEERSEHAIEKDKCPICGRSDCGWNMILNRTLEY